MLKMSTIRVLLVLLLTFNLISYAGIAQEREEQKTKPKIESVEIKNDAFPETIGIVNDYSQIFDEAQEVELSEMLYNYNIKTTRQIVVVTVDDISPYNDIQKYASDLAGKWGVGSADKNNGLVVVLCLPLRKVGIATGIGTQLILTNETCKEVIDNIMVPEFKAERYYLGIKKGISELIIKWDKGI